MTAFDSAETHIFRRAHSASEAPIMISRDDAQQDLAGVYVLVDHIRAASRMGAATMA